MRVGGMRWILVLIHRYVGLSIAGFLFIAGLTGAILTFEPELDATLNPKLFSAPQPDKPRLPLDELISRVEASDPRVDVTAALLPLRSDESVMMRVAAASGKAAIDFDQIFVDPATGNILSRRLWGECCLGREKFIPFIYQVHLTLFLPGNAGGLIMGSIALAWLFDSFIGLALAWPRGRGRRHGWPQVLTFKRGGRGFRSWFDTHRVAGLWPFPILIVMAVTGTALNLHHQVAVPVVSFFSPLKEGVFETLPTEPRPPAALSYEDAARLAEAAARDEFRRPTTVYEYHVPEAGVYGVAVTEPVGNPRNGLGPSWVYIDDRSGAVRDRDTMGEGSAGDVFMQARLPMHSGRVAGDGGRIIVALIGLMVAVLSASGVYLWWRKRVARLDHQAKVHLAKLSNGPA